MQFIFHFCSISKFIWWHRETLWVTNTRFQFFFSSFLRARFFFFFLPEFFSTHSSSDVMLYIYFYCSIRAKTSSEWKNISRKNNENMRVHERVKWTKEIGCSLILIPRYKRPIMLHPWIEHKSRFIMTHLSGFIQQ